MGHISDCLNNLFVSLKTKLVDDKSKNNWCRKAEEQIQQVQSKSVPECILEITVLKSFDKDYIIISNDVDIKIDRKNISQIKTISKTRIFQDNKK